MSPYFFTGAEDEAYREGERDARNGRHEDYFRSRYDGPTDRAYFQGYDKQADMERRDRDRRELEEQEEENRQRQRDADETLRRSIEEQYYMEQAAQEEEPQEPEIPEPGPPEPDEKKDVLL